MNLLRSMLLGAFALLVTGTIFNGLCVIFGVLGGYKVRIGYIDQSHPEQLLAVCIGGIALPLPFVSF